MRAIAFALALACGACTTIPAVPTAPNAIADQTVLDEKLGIAVEAAYTAAARAGALAIRAGLVDAAGAQRIHALSERAYAAVLVTRRAYDAGNAANYGAAATQALALIAELTNLTRN